jgi:hypothetical protein
MLSLKTIGTRENTATVTLRGNAVEVRGLTIADHRRIDAALLAPMPPVGKNPEKGDLAAPEPLYNDPGYRAKVAEHVAMLMAAEFIVSTGWTTAAGKTWSAVAANPEHAAAFLRTATEELIEAGIGKAELEVVNNAAESLAAGKGGNPRGNSSSASESPASG